MTLMKSKTTHARDGRARCVGTPSIAPDSVTYGVAGVGIAAEKELLAISSTAGVTDDFSGA